MSTEEFSPVTEFESKGEAVGYIRGRLSSLEYIAEAIRTSPTRNRHHMAAKVRREITKLRYAADAIDGMSD